MTASSSPLVLPPGRRGNCSSTPLSKARYDLVVNYSTKGAGRKGGSDSKFVTPGAASRKKRKLFSNTPQHSQVWLCSVLQYKGSREEGGQ